MKKKFSLIIILFVLGISLSFGFDLGLSADNSTSINTYGERFFGHWDKLALWLRTNREKPLSFSFTGSYTFSLERPYLFDVDDLRLKGKFLSGLKGPASFEFDIGRYQLSDFTGLVVSHKADGFRFGFRYPFAYVEASFGFTGLLLKPNSTVILSRVDALSTGIDKIKLGSPRLIGELAVQFPGLFLRQNITLSALFQEDLRSTFQNVNTPPEVKLLEEGEKSYYPEKGGSVDSQYFGLGIGGPIGGTSIYYDAFFYLGTGRTLTYIENMYTYTSIFSYLTGGGVRYYNEALLFSTIALSGAFASGDSDQMTFFEGNTQGKATTFTPVSKSTLGLIFSPRLGNIFYLQASYGLKPLSILKNDLFKELQVSVKGIPFFRTTTGSISEAGIDKTSTDKYLGTEIDGSVSFRPFSDLGAGLSVGLFMPNEKVFIEEMSGLRFLLRLDFSLLF
ncbi:MAG: hypothetical protein DRP87_11255 [Spirochaetes bacterium]|nr:MAG: hypothetical protein DRP87_11255 [Spirochaetota bacterium]